MTPLEFVVGHVVVGLAIAALLFVICCCLWVIA